MTRTRSAAPATKDDMTTRARVRSECVEAMVRLARAAEHRAELPPAHRAARLPGECAARLQPLPRREGKEGKVLTFCP